MTISFEREDKELILCYSPEMGTDEIADRLSSGKEVWIKHTFVVNKSLLRDSDSSDYEDNLRFCIGSVDDSYTLLNPEVIKTDHKFFFSNDIKLKQSMFVAYRNISILRKIDALVERDIYVGGSWDAKGGIPFEAYQSLIESFPKTAELDKYANSRIALCIKEYFPECDKYEQIYERFLAKGKHIHSVLGRNDEIELAQFSAALEELKQLLNNGAGINEADWQIRIRDILQLLYPKNTFFVHERLRFRELMGMISARILFWWMRMGMSIFWRSRSQMSGSLRNRLPIAIIMSPSESFLEQFSRLRNTFSA